MGTLIKYEINCPNCKRKEVNMAVGDTDKYTIKTLFMCRECGELHGEVNNAINCYDSHKEEYNNEIESE